LDSAHHTVLGCYRISNNQNVLIRVTAINLITGGIVFQKDIDVHADNLTLEDVAVDTTGIYLCGSAINLYEKFSLGLLIRLDPITGEIEASHLIGKASFNSNTSFRDLKLDRHSLILTASRSYKRLMYFPTVEWSTVTIDKEKLMR